MRNPLKYPNNSCRIGYLEVCRFLSDWISEKPDFCRIGYPKSLPLVGLNIRKACRRQAIKE